MTVMREMNAKPTQVHPGNPAGMAAEAFCKRALVTGRIVVLINLLTSRVLSSSLSPTWAKGPDRGYRPPS